MHVGRGETVALNAGRIEARQRDAKAEHDEVGLRNAVRGNGTARRADQRADHVGEAPPHAVHEPGRRQGREREPQLVQADRQGGCRRVGRELLPHQSAQRNDDGRRGPAQ